MRILVACHGLWPKTPIGGMEKQTFNFCKRMVERGVDAVCAVPFDQIQGDEPFATVGIPWPKIKPWLFANHMFARGVREHARANPYDAAVSMGLAMDGWVRMEQTPMLFHTTGLHYFQPQSYGGFATLDPRVAWMRFVARRLVRESDFVSIESPYLCEILRNQVAREDREKIHTIYPGVKHPGSTLPLRTAERSILFVGRFSYEKGVDTLLSIAARLIPKGYHFTVIGSGPLENRIRSKSSAAFRVLSPMGSEELLEMYRAHEVFLIPSRAEGIPQVLFEAMGQGLLPVVSEISGMRDLIDQETVLGFEMGDIDQAVHRLGEFFSNPAHVREAIRQRARRRANQEFGEDRFIEDYARAIEGMIR